MFARRVLASDERLGELKALAGVGYDQCGIWSCRCQWLKDLIECSSNPSNPIELPACIREPPLLGNTFKKNEKKLTQYNLFYSFVDMNSIPTGRRAHEKNSICPHPSRPYHLQLQTVKIQVIRSRPDIMK